MNIILLLKPSLIARRKHLLKIPYFHHTRPAFPIKNMLMRYRMLLSLFLLLVCAAGCTNTKREEQLARREAALFQKEKDFALKEAEYKALLRMRDSLLAVRDTVSLQAWPPEIAGMWTGRSLCRESSCRDYVVGDQRTANWEFLADSTGLYAKIVNNNKVVRVFHGEISNDQLLLGFRTDSGATKPIEIQVALNMADSTLMKGTQLVKGENDCTARFSVELSRVSKMN